MTHAQAQRDESVLGLLAQGITTEAPDFLPHHDEGS